MCFQWCPTKRYVEVLVLINVILSGDEDFADVITMRSYCGKVKVAQSCPTLCDPMDYVVHGILQARILEWVAFPFSRGSSQPRSSAMQVDSLPAEPQGKPKNTGVDSLSLLQRILLTQELNWGLHKGLISKMYKELMNSRGKNK